MFQPNITFVQACMKMRLQLDEDYLQRKKGQPATADYPDFQIYLTINMVLKVSSD